MKKNKRLLVAMTALMVAALLVTARVVTGGAPDAKSKTSAAAPGMQKVSVGMYIAEPRPLIETSVVPGTVMASEQVVLKAEASGRITQLALKEGTEVKKNDLLVKIYDADLQAQLQKARAELKLSQDREKRQKTLLEKNMISQEEYDQVIKELSVSEADIDLLAAQIAKTEIRAPFDGRVGLRMVSEGAYLSVGTPIADFLKIRPLKIEFAVPERFAGKIGVDSKILFSIQGSPVRYSATVFACQPGIEEATRSLRMRAVCRDAAGNVYPGAFANVEIALGSNPHAIVVPTESVVPDISGQKVYLVKSGKAVPQAVTTGVRNEATVEITEGLSPGDTVVTTGVLMLRPGMAVDIKKQTNN
jgi:membrane fusion protein, multidrug efflux system